MQFVRFTPHSSSPATFLAMIALLSACGAAPAPPPAADGSTPSDTAQAIPAGGAAAPGIPAALTPLCDDVAGALMTLFAFQPRRLDGAYADQFRGASRVGCQFSGAARFSQMAEGVRGPIEGMMDWFEAREFRHDMQYSADGPTGALVGMRHDDVLCLIRAEWEGGLDADIVFTEDELDRYHLWVECAVDTEPGFFAGD